MAYIQDNCCSEVSGACPVTVAIVQSKSIKGNQSEQSIKWPTHKIIEMSEQSIKWPTYKMIVVLRSLVTVQSQLLQSSQSQSKGMSEQSIEWPAQKIIVVVSGVCLVTVADILLAVNNSPVAITTPFVLYLYFGR